MRQPTAKYELIQTRLGRALDAYITQARTEQRSWRTIAADLTAATGVPVTHQTLRDWFPAIRRAA